MRGRKKTEETRQAILRCAAEVFSARPYHEVLTEALSARLKIGKGTLYRYFDSKEDLYFATIVQGLQGMREAIDTALAQDAPFEQRIEGLTRTLIGYFWERRDFFVLLQRHEPKLDPGERAEWQKGREELVDMVAAALAKEMRARVSGTINARLAVEMLFGMIRAACMYRAETDRIDALVRQVTTIFLGGVLAGPAPVAAGASITERRRPASRPRRTAPRRLRTAAVLLGVGVALQATGCVRTNDSRTEKDGQAQVKAEPVPVTVATVSVQPSQRVLKFVGTLFGDEEVTLSSQIEGQIQALNVDLGDPVANGQILAVIDDAQLRAHLRELDAMRDKARADEARGRALVARQVISPQEYETMKTTAAVAEAQRDAQNVLIEHSRVLSPLTGSVASRVVSVGEYVHAGTPLLKLVADQPLKLRGDVPERFAQELATGQPVQIQVDAFPGQTFLGRLARISPSVNRDNRSIGVEAVVENGDRRLKPGFFANASIVTRAEDEALMVPQTAIVSFAGVTRLFVVDHDVAQQREVRTGTRGGEGLVEIIDGVRRDEKVVTSGLTKLENGAAVTIRNADG